MPTEEVSIHFDVTDFFFKCRSIKQQVNELSEPFNVASYEREMLRELGEFQHKCETKELNWSQFFDLENRSHSFKWIVLQLWAERLQSDADTAGREGTVEYF